MRLFIAEKPNMAREIAKNLPGTPKAGKGYIETGAGIVTWLYGHILQQAAPEEYDPKYKYWKAEDLPIVPSPWKLNVAPKTKDQYKIIKELCEKADEIIHAGDPDREGQLLVDEVLLHVKNKKPVQRLLLNALDEKSVKAALAKLQSNKNFANLSQAALGRARADWLIGMNLSRAFTLAVKRQGLDMVLPIGRVKTPTLGLVVRREREIANFKPTDHYKIKVLFSHPNGQFQAVWKPNSEQPGIDSEGRLISQAVVEKMLAKFSTGGRTGMIMAYECTDGQEPPKLPYSLSALQIEAGKIFNYDPQTVLESAQKLYERQLTTYPRSDCDYLPTSQLADAPTIIRNLSACAGISPAAKGANLSLQSRAWNDGKITAHHAIIPTTVKFSETGLTETDINIYKLIAKTYIVQFYPNFTYKQTKVLVSYSGELFSATGKQIVKSGWREIWGHDEAEKKTAGENDEANATLPLMAKRDNVDFVSAEEKALTTKPPARFTPGSLIEAMKEIHKYVKDPDLKKQLKDVSGIGTEATRATIIAELQARKLLLQNKKQLIPGDAAYVMIDLLPDEMTYPDQTAKWENCLGDIQAGESALDAFLTAQVQFVSNLCEKAKKIAFGNSKPAAQTVTPIAPSKPSAGPQPGKPQPLAAATPRKPSSTPAKPTPAKPTPAKAAPQHKCPSCGKRLIRREYQKRFFWGCEGYPNCRYSANDNKGKPSPAKK